MPLVLARERHLPPAQRRELRRLESEVHLLMGRLRQHPLMGKAFLAELLGGAEIAETACALAERPDLVALVRQQLAYGPPTSAAPCNVLNAGFGGS